MKKSKMILSALVVFAVVGSALAFKPLGAGSVYCIDNGTTCSDLRNFRINNTTGTVTDVCNGSEFQQIANDCVEIQSGNLFSATPAGN